MSQEVEFQKIVEKYQKYESLMDNGRRLYQEKDYELAIEHFQKVLEMRPDYVLAKQYIRLSQEMIKHREDKERNEALIAELIERRNKIESHFNKGKELYQQGDYEASLAYFQKGIGTQPKNALAKQYFALNQRFLKLRHEKEVAQMKALEQSKAEQLRLSRNKQLRDQVNKLYDSDETFEQESYDLAAIELEGILNIDPDHALAKSYYDIAQRYVNVQETKEQIKLEQERKVEQESLEKFLKGKELFKQEKYEQAVKLFRKSWELNPLAYYNPELQTFIENAFKNIEMRRQLERENQLQKDAAYSYEIFNEGVGLFEQEKYQQAIQLFTRALDIYPASDHATKIEQFIEKAYQKNKEQAMRQRNDRITRIYDQAVTEYKALDFQAALDKFLQVQALDPKFEDVKLYIKLARKALDQR